jgi:transcriptional antiterminator RfaH
MECSFKTCHGLTYNPSKDLTHMNDDGRKNWYCIYTKANQEDKVCRKLGELPGIELLNPKLKRRKPVRSKMTEVVEELFPCYIFSKFDPYRYFHMIKYTRGVRRFVGDRLGDPYVVDESIIECITSKMTDGIIHCEVPRLGQGDKVVVLEGPFSGLTGLFLSELKPNERVLILLDTIKFQGRIRLPREFVSKA